MHDGDALLAAVLAAPAADLPRLVYADWLEEHGEPARAELIRVQCELDRSPDAGARLRARESRLLADQAVRAAFPGFRPVPAAAREEWVTRAALRATVFVSRGFVTGVVAPLAELVHEPAPGGSELARFRLSPTLIALVAREPVEWVEPSDRDPIETDGEWFWLPEGEPGDLNTIPAALYDGLTGGREFFDGVAVTRAFADRAGAVASLSRLVLSLRTPPPAGRP